jgi:N-methylhydantoinase A
VKLYIGIDVGGTFTDVVVLDDSSCQISVLKISTTTKNPERAIMDALQEIKHEASRVQIINHATTIATNALLTHSGLAKTALVTNRGFRDVLEIGRQRRADLYDLYNTRPPPLVKRSARFTIHGRMLFNGLESEPIQVKEVKKLAKKVDKERFECVVVGLLNSYANSIHEKKVARIIKRKKFKGDVVLSSEVNNEYREYERLSTAVVNAALLPLASRYLSTLRSSLHESGYSAPIYLMKSNGDVSTITHASRFPVSIIESGPAAGVLACVDLAKELHLNRVATFDMGGTTAKAGMVLNFQPDIAYEFEAAGKTHSGRAIRGSGYPVRQPFIDLAEVSAGGGTIAWVDEGGSLRLGPQSAGSEPGPAAYGKGGKEPTVTDANILLGRLNPKHLLGGEMTVYSELAYSAMKERVANRLETTTKEAAESVIEVANHRMARAISIVSVERGRDPREFVLIAFGGAGPLHACDLAEQMAIKSVIVPRNPGLFSAYGLLTVNLGRTFLKPVMTTNLDLSIDFNDLKLRASRTLQEEGFSTFSLEQYVDLRYLGQSFELTLPYMERNKLRKSFDKKHESIYGYSSKDPLEVVNAKVRAVVSIPKIVRRKLDSRESGPKTSSFRTAWISGAYGKVPVYVRENLSLGNRETGPCIIEEYDSTTIVNGTWLWRIDEFENIVMRREEG